MMAKGKRLARTEPDDEPKYGPAMRALHPKWRLAVQAVFLTKCDQSAALRMAGYRGTPESINVMASRIFNDERVQAAIIECSRAAWRGLFPAIVRAAGEVIKNPDHRDHGRVLGKGIDAFDPQVTRQEVNMNMTVHRDDAEMLILSMQLALEMNPSATFEDALRMIGHNRDNVAELERQWHELRGRTIAGEVIRPPPMDATTVMKLDPERRPGRESPR